MKKPFPTVLDSTAELQASIVVSAGRLGQQVELAPAELLRITGGKTVPVTHAHEKSDGREDIPPDLGNNTGVAPETICAR